MLVNFEKNFMLEVSADEAWKHVEHLSTIDKTSGTEGEVKAHEYVRKKLKEYKVPFDAYEFDSYISHPLDALLRVTKPEKRSIECRPAAFGGKTIGDGISGELVYVELPAGTLFGGIGGLVDLYKKAGVEGKIPIVWGLAAPTVMWAAQEAGALAQIHISGEDVIHEMIVTTIWGTPTPESAERLPKIPALSIKKSDGEHLLTLLKEGGVKVSLTSSVETKWRKIPITVARIEGKEEPEKFMLVHGHMDSWYYGTTDNCTGNAACLELCRIFGKHRDKLKRSLHVAWWAGHSTGRYSGSTWYADNFYDDLYKNCFVTMNIDSPGVKGATNIGGGGLMGTVNFMAEVIRDATGLEKFSVATRYSRAGDQSFYGIGIPSVGANGHIPEGSPLTGRWTGGSGGGWWWHNPADTVDKGDKDIFYRDVKMEILTVTRFLTCKVLPFSFVDVSKDYENALLDLQKRAPKNKDYVNPTMDRVKTMKTKAEALNKALEGLQKSSDAEKITKINHLLEKIAKVLTTTLYTYSGRHDQDPAYSLGVVPLLQPLAELGKLKPGSDEAGFLRTRIVRNANRVNDELESAIKLMEKALRICEE